uniref:Uncharacterized protein n=1 Tax=Rhizophora mucronata TaxID=61149 RepID=A0A2P2JHH6_RHIMU
MHKTEQPCSWKFIDTITLLHTMTESSYKFHLFVMIIFAARLTLSNRGQFNPVEGSQFSAKRKRNYAGETKLKSKLENPRISRVHHPTRLNIIIIIQVSCNSYWPTEN